MTARSYMGTLNNPVTPLAEYLQKFMTLSRFVTGQKEVGENGTPHY